MRAIDHSDEVLIFPAVSGDPLATRLAQRLGVELAPVNYARFLSAVPGGEETKPEIRVNVKKRTAVIIWSPGMTNDELVQLLFTINALKKVGRAHEVILVVPYYPYARQDKTHGRREPISAQVIAMLFETVGLTDIIYVDVHSDQIEGFFRTTSAQPLWMDDIYVHYLANRVAEIKAAKGISLVKGMPPDEGSVTANYRVVRKLRHEMAVHLKKRNWDSLHSVTSLGIAGGVSLALVWSRDDILASGDSIFSAAAQAKAAGASYVLAVITHALGFDKPGSDSFVDKLNASPLDELVVTNSVSAFTSRVEADPGLRRKISVLDITPLLANVLERHVAGETVREMMKELDPGALYEELIVSDQALSLRNSS